jgi:hypothetical protein
MGGFNGKKFAKKVQKSAAGEGKNISNDWKNESAKKGPTAAPGGVIAGVAKRHRDQVGGGLSTTGGDISKAWKTAINGGETGGKGGSAPGAAAPAAPAGNWWDQGRPKQITATDANGQLKDGFKVTAGSTASGLDTRLNQIGPISTGQDFTSARSSVNDLSNLANTQGATSHAKYLTDAQRLEEDSARDDIDSSMRGMNATAFNDLAASGGLDSGARERIAGNSANQNLIERQKLARQGQLSRANILSNDEQMKIGLKRELPGQYLALDQHNVNTQKDNAQLSLNKANMWQGAAAADANRTLDADRFNVGNQLSDMESQNKWNFGMWDYDNKGIAADKTANAESAFADKLAEQSPWNQAKKFLGTEQGRAGAAFTMGGTTGALANAAYTNNKKNHWI